MNKRVVRLERKLRELQEDLQRTKERAEIYQECFEAALEYCRELTGKPAPKIQWPAA